MSRRKHLRKVYKTFENFIAETSSIELEYLILQAEYTSNFNNKLKFILEQIKNEGKYFGEFMVMLNTEGEIALINENILGNYISNLYKLRIEAYYKNINLNKIVKSMIRGSEKSQEDFIFLSYKVIYELLGEIFKTIKCRKETVDFYMRYYTFEKKTEEDVSLKIATSLILEDICKYMGINYNILNKCINK